MSRWSAAGVHFLISLAILTMALLLMRLFWYPDFYFAAIGADGLLAILFAVDVTLGPLITLIIFKSGKKGLKFDLAFIAVCQLTALFYGMYTVFLARPAFAVFDADRFQVVQAIDVDLSGARHPEFQAVSLTGPRWVAVKSQKGDEEFSKAVLNAVAGGKDLWGQARFFVPFEEVKDDAIAKVKPLQRLRRTGAEANKRLDDFLSAHGVREEDVGYLPLMARAENMAVIVARKNGDILGVVRVQPW